MEMNMNSYMHHFKISFSYLVIVGILVDICKRKDIKKKIKY